MSNHPSGVSDLEFAKSRGIRELIQSSQERQEVATASPHLTNETGSEVVTCAGHTKLVSDHKEHGGCLSSIHSTPR